MRILVLLAIVGLIPVRPDRHGTVDAPPPVIVSLQGTWQMVEYSVMGKILPKTTVDNMKLSFSSNEMRLETGAKAASPFPFTMDLNKSPAWIDFKTTKTVGFAGIWKIEGDTLTICFARSDPNLRPTTFPTDPGDPKVYYWRLKRIK